MLGHLRGTLGKVWSHAKTVLKVRLETLREPPVVVRDDDLEDFDVAHDASTMEDLVNIFSERLREYPSRAIFAPAKPGQALLGVEDILDLALLHDSEELSPVDVAALFDVSGEDFSAFFGHNILTGSCVGSMWVDAFHLDPDDAHDVKWMMDEVVSRARLAQQQGVLIYCVTKVAESEGESLGMRWDRKRRKDILCKWLERAGT